MWLLHGPLTRYVKLQVAHAPGMLGTFSPAADFKGNRKLAIPTCITARAWRTCRDACRDRAPAVTGKTFPAFPVHAHLQFCVSGKRPIVSEGNLKSMVKSNCKLNLTEYGELWRCHICSYISMCCFMSRQFAISLCSVPCYYGNQQPIRLLQHSRGLDLVSLVDKVDPVIMLQGVRILTQWSHGDFPIFVNIWFSNINVR